MSKKIMKRSLALGALMAFVITGSAMAAELTSGNSVITAGEYEVNSDVTISGSKEVMVGKASYYSLSDAERVKITLASDKTLTIVTDTDEGGDLHGVIANTDIIGDLDSNTRVIIQTNSESEHAAGLGMKSVDKIQANYIKIYSAGGYALYNSNSYSQDSHTLIGNEIVLESKGRTLLNSTGITNITADSLTVISDRSAEGKANNALTVNGNGEININANEVVLTGGIDLMNTEEADLNIKNVDKTGSPDVMQITGNINAAVGTLSGLSLDGDDSFVKGTINTNEKSAVEFSDSAYWENTGDSNVAKLTLDEGVIKQTSGENKITVGTLSGEGTLEVADATADQMVIDAKADGAKLTVSTSDQDINLEELVGVASTKNDDGSTSNAADIVEKTGGSVYDKESATVNEDGSLGETVKQIAAANVSVNDMVAIGMMSWRAEMNDMNKRMGELRNANGEHGVWVRMVRGESEYNSVKNQYNQYQLGYDEKLSVDKRWTVGVALSYTDAENNFAQGTGESTNKALSVYGSKLNDDGTFIDLIAKYARLENDFTVQGGQGDADYDTNAYSFSAEAGKRIQQGKGLWIEPQVELTYGKVSAVDYVTKNDVKVAQDGMESLVGRIGFSLGKDIEKGNVYARASYLYDFDGETKATLNNDAVLENDLGGGWWEVGVGANINLSKATYIYADIEKTFGGEVDTNWQWNLGVRYSF